MTYTEILKVPQDELKEIRQLLETGENFNGKFTEDDTITYSVVFHLNGYTADIKVCGANEDLPWTEMVLFDKNGSECTCTDVSEDFEGEWELEYNGDIYKVLVVEK